MDEDPSGEIHINTVIHLQKQINYIYHHGTKNLLSKHYQVYHP